MHPYAPRPIRFLGVREHGGWRVKLYSIVFGGDPPELERFRPAFELAMRELPSPAVTAERPGVAVMIAHQGRSVDYAVLGWWDRENELPVRVYVRDRATGAAWRPAREGESFCVWDLQVLWFEREAYVATVLGGRGAAAVDDYLDRALAAGA